MSAAETIRSRDGDAEIVIVGADPHGYYSRPGLAYLLAKEELEKTLFPFTPQDIARLGARMLVDRVSSIDSSTHTASLESGGTLEYDRLLIATGSLAIPVNVPGAGLQGVVKLDDLDDARDLIARSRRAKAAVVVGGGITALEIVEGLRERHVHVHYFMRRDRYWSNVLSESESRIVEQGLQARGVQIHYYTELAEILGKDGKVVGVATQKGLQIPCDLVAVAIGVRPLKGLAEAAGLECGRGVLVDRFLRSNSEDIFAAGDVAEVRDTLSGQRVLEVLWGSAVDKGRVAGLNMATEPVHAYDKGPAPLNVTRLAGFKITIIGTVGSGKDSDLEGLARGDSQTWRDLGEAVMIESGNDDTHVRLAVAGGILVGAVVMGDQALSFPLQELIGARADVSGRLAALQEPSASVANLVNGLWRESKANHV